MQAAAAGQLQDLATVQNHARRILTNNPAAAAKLKDFFRYYVQMDVASHPFEPAAQLDKIDPSGLYDEMVAESQAFVNYVTFTKHGTFKDLLTSQDVFPKSARLATILETTQAVGDTPAQTNAAHAGILLRPLFLAGGDAQTKPMHRAASIVRHVLCEVLGSPDLAGLQNRQKELGDLSALSNRDRLTTLTSPQGCMGCHRLLNPIGFALEGYDQVGVPRTTETVFDLSGAVTHTFPIVTATTDNPPIEPGGPTSLGNARDLVTAIASGGKARSCFAETMYDYIHLRVSDPNDACAIHDVEAASKDDGSILQAYLNSVANEDIFYRGLGN
jgi:hypothetical protein